MNTKNRRRTTLILLTLFLSLLIPSGIATADSFLTSTPTVSSVDIQHPIAYCGSTPYQSIQEAINHAPTNGTVIITQGTHTEILTIDKPLRLIGNSPDTTLLAPASTKNSYAIQITAEYVTITNLTIHNAAAGSYTTGIKIMKPYTTITRCVIRDTPIGIALWATHTSITHSTFFNCSDEGIALFGTTTTACTDNHITNCTFIENGDGVELQWSSQNRISDCRFQSNIHAGIDMIASANTNNVVSTCEFVDNQGFGMYCTGASRLQVTDCTFSSDSLMLVSTQGSIISRSDVEAIQLLRNSTVIIDRCDTVTHASISAQASQYILLPSSSDSTNTNRHPLRGLVSTLIARLHFISLLASLLRQIRM